MADCRFERAWSVGQERGQVMGMNRVILMGYLTRDPELRHTPRGGEVAVFGLAVNRFFADADGNRQEEVSFFDVEAWARRGEVIAEYLHKGDPILIEGRLKQERWQDQEGQNRSKVKAVVENFQFVGNRSSREEFSTPDLTAAATKATEAQAAGPERRSAQNARHCKSGSTMATSR